MDTLDIGTLDTVKFSNIKMIIAGTHSMNYTKYLPPGSRQSQCETLRNSAIMLQGGHLVGPITIYYVMYLHEARWLDIITCYNDKHTHMHTFIHTHRQNTCTHCGHVHKHAYKCVYLYV